MSHDPGHQVLANDEDAPTTRLTRISEDDDKDAIDRLDETLDGPSFAPVEGKPIISVDAEASLSVAFVEK